MAIEIVIDTLGYTQDVLAGLNVREYNYVAEYVERCTRDHDEDMESVCVPFVVMAHDSGLDYDEDGNSYFDDYPSDFVVSAHRTRKGAECEVAWHEHHCPGQRVWIVEDHWVYQYELKYHPVRD